MNEQPNFEIFKQEVSKLNSLLQDPQPGLFTWHSFLDERIRNIVKCYYGKHIKIIKKDE